MPQLRNKQKLDPQVWYPYFKFTLQTIGMTYPNNPNDVTKKKYFTLIQNLPFYHKNQHALKTYFSHKL